MLLASVRVRICPSWGDQLLPCKRWMRQPPRITRYTVIGIKVTVKPPILLSRLISSTLHMAVVWMWLLQVWYHCWQREWARMDRKSKFKVQSSKFHQISHLRMRSIGFLNCPWARESGTSHWLTTYRIQYLGVQHCSVKKKARWVRALGGTFV